MPGISDSIREQIIYPLLHLPQKEKTFGGGKDSFSLHQKEIAVWGGNDISSLRQKEIALGEEKIFPPCIKRKWLLGRKRHLFVGAFILYLIRFRIHPIDNSANAG